MEKTPKITDFEEFIQVFSNSLSQRFAIFNNFFIYFLQNISKFTNAPFQNTVQPQIWQFLTKFTHWANVIKLFCP